MTAYVSRVVQPGTFLEGAPTHTHALMRLIHELVSQMVDANIALNRFNEGSMQASEVRRAHMEAMLQRQRPEPPSRLITQQPFLFARMFVFALDHLGRALGALAKTSGAPQGLKATYRAFMDQFPGLKGTRDSEHHRDERQMGLARGKPIRPHAVKIPGAVTAPAGAIILVGNLVGTKLTCTSEFGDVVEVDVSLASLKKVEKMVQDALNLFQWKGQPVQLP